MIGWKPAPANRRWLQAIYLEGSECRRFLIRYIDQTAASVLNLLISQSFDFFDEVGAIPDLNQIVILDRQKLMSEIVVPQAPDGDVLGLVGGLAEVADLVGDPLAHRILIIFIFPWVDWCAPDFDHTLLACSEEHSVEGGILLLITLLRLHRPDTMHTCNRINCAPVSSERAV